MKAATPQMSASAGSEGGARWKTGWRKMAGVIKRSAHDRCAGGKISQQQRPCGGDAEERRQCVCRVGVERSWRSGEPREPADAKADKQRGPGGKQVDKPGGVAGQGEDQRNGQRRRSAGRHGGDRLRQVSRQGRARRRAGRSSQLRLLLRTLRLSSSKVQSLFRLSCPYSSSGCSYRSEVSIARSWPRYIRAAHRWGQRCGWDCPGRTGSGRQAGGAGWAW